MLPGKATPSHRQLIALASVVQAEQAEVVAAVRGGLLSLDEACKRYTLTVEEFLAWQHAIDRFGLAGLARDTGAAVSQLRREA